MRVKTKAAVLEGGVEFPDLVAFSVYDTNPVNFLSMVAQKLVCNINKKDIYDKATKKNVSIQFYQTELQNFNNNHMNSVDVYNQIRDSNIFHH